MKRSNLLKEAKSERNIINILISFFSGIILFFISFLLSKPWVNWDNIRILFCTLLTTIATVLFFNVVWEILAKKSFAQQLIQLVHISENILRSGIETVYVDFKAINWDIELKDAKKIRAVFTYSTRWGKNNAEVFKSLHKSGCQLEVYLPNPNHPKSIDTLNQRFFSLTSVEQIDTKKEIEYAIGYYFDLGFDIYLYDGVFQNSYYLIDEIAFMSFFNHQKPQGKVTYGVPAIKATYGGELYSYISAEIDAIHDDSKKHEKSEAI